MQKIKFNRYNDGKVSIYREKKRETDFSAKRNVGSTEDMDFIVKLDFEESTKREQDLEFAEQRGFSLSLKVRTRLFPDVDNKCKAVVDGYLYDIFSVDKSRTEMWLFMEGVKKLNA